MSEVLDDYRSVWHRKPVSRLVYEDFYDRIVSACVPGTAIEIGRGIGNLKARLADVIVTEIQFTLGWIALPMHTPAVRRELSSEHRHGRCPASHRAPRELLQGSQARTAARWADRHGGARNHLGVIFVLSHLA
jgi:hypothetical protein